MNLEKLKTGCIALLSILLLYFAALTTVQFENLNELQEDKSLFEKLFDYNKLTANKRLGLANTKLVQQEQLNNKYLQELTIKDKEFEEFRKKHQLEITSKDELIAKLINDLNGGDSDTSGPCVKDKNNICIPVQYTWQDHLSRFKLVDPNIWIKNNENFKSSQMFRLKGQIFSDKTGSFSVRKVFLEEIYDSDPNKNGIQVAKVPNSQIEIVDNNFEYVSELEKRKKHILDIFTFRPLATFDTTFNPGLGFEFLNLGRFFDYSNLGLYSKLSTDFNNNLVDSVINTRIGLGLNYHLIPPLLPTNFAVGASVSFPFTNLAQPMLSIDVMLYLTEDLNPFVSKK